MTGDLAGASPDWTVTTSPQAAGAAGAAWARGHLAPLARCLPRPGFLAGSAPPPAALRIRRRLPNARGKHRVIGGSQPGPSGVAGGDY